MRILRDSILLRIFVGEDDTFDQQPLYEAIVLRAREMHLSGATVLLGPNTAGSSKDPSRPALPEFQRYSFQTATQSEREALAARGAEPGLPVPFGGTCDGIRGNSSL